MNIHFYLVINGEAGSGNGHIAAKKIIKQLENRQLTYTAVYTEYPQHEKLLVQQLAETALLPWSNETVPLEFPLLVILGGDGTLHEALNTLHTFNTNIPIGYIPCGSGNDFAKGVGINKNAERAFLQILSAAAPQEIQLIRYQEEIQAETGIAENNIGIGLDAAIVETTNQSHSKKALNKFKLGSLAYIFSILKVLFTQKGFPIMVEINGKKLEFQKAFLCTVTNHPYFGGGIAIAPKADPRKPLLDLVIVERISLFKIFWLIFLLTRKKHMESKHFYHFQSSKIKIVSTIPQYVHADGEILGKRNLDMSYSLEKALFWF